MNEARGAPPRRSRRWPRPTAAGWILLSAALSVGFLRPPGALSDALAATLALLWVGAWLWAWGLPLEQLKVRRRLPRSATKGEAVPVVHELANPSPRILHHLLVEEWNPSQDPARECRSYFPQLLPEARGESRARLFLGRRGRLQLQGLSIWGGDPFGLFRVEVRVWLEGEVLVRPRPQEVLGRWALAQARRSRAGGAPAEWATVREWRPGDPLRWVSWRLSARRGYPIVRTGPLRDAQRAAIVLDIRPGERRIDFERAVALAAGLALVLLRRGARVTLHLGAETLAPLGAASGASLLLERLAVVEELSGAPLVVPPGAYLVTARRLTPGEGAGAALALESPRLPPGALRQGDAPARLRAAS